MERVEYPAFTNGFVMSNNITYPASTVNSRATLAGTSLLSDCGDDGGKNERGRKCELEFARLLKAARPNGLEREASLDKFWSSHVRNPSISGWSQILDTKPTLEVRNTIGSQSCTDTIIHFSRPTSSNSLVRMDDDSNEDESPLQKPLLVRRKSGELVQPALKPSPRGKHNSIRDMFTNSRSVHFNDSDNEIRHFFKHDNAINISADSSPVETRQSGIKSPFGVRGEATRGLKLTNFPQLELERGSKPIRVESLFLSPDKDTLVGTIAVQNLSFQKLVVARFTLDHWRTTSELVAEYERDLRNLSIDGCDRFTFHMVLSDIADLEDKSLLLCARYNVNGQDYWDNNNSMDYRIEFVRAVENRTRLTPDLCPVVEPLSAVPRIQHRPPTSSYLIDQHSGAGTGLGLNPSLDPSSEALDKPHDVNKFDVRLKGNILFSAGLPKLHTNFKGRYNFDTSLTVQNRCRLGIL